ncbi:CLUMA_CG010285, isoform A [Clunio marinus]|uniref:CLUMA_CG010285, isoform A n=1 Tax=Clunio marinus TaxID=568069 RepID=A0A1J1I8X2_9DIPT|nr:CLUMA_CG010285, isoform A [Clunio marinus]
MKETIILFCIICYITSGSASYGHQRCVQNYLQNKALHPDCKNIILELSESVAAKVESLIKVSFKEHQFSPFARSCGWNLMNKNKVVGISLKPFAYHYANIEGNQWTTEQEVEAEVKSTIEILVRYAKQICQPEINLGPTFINEMNNLKSFSSSSTHNDNCAISYLIKTDFIDSQLYNIDASLYENDDCELEFTTWRDNFPKQNLQSFHEHFPETFFGFPCTNVSKCLQQKMKDQKLNQYLLSFRHSFYSPMF